MERLHQRSKIAVLVLLVLALLGAVGWSLVTWHWAGLRGGFTSCAVAFLLAAVGSAPDFKSVPVHPGLYTIKFQKALMDVALAFVFALLALAYR